MTVFPVSSMTCAPSGALTGRRVANLRDASVAHDDRLVLARRRAGAVDHARVREHDGRRVDGDVLEDVLGERGTLRERGSRDRDDGGAEERREGGGSHAR